MACWKGGQEVGKAGGHHSVADRDKTQQNWLKQTRKTGLQWGVQAPRLGHQYSFFLSLGPTSLSMLATFPPTEDGTHSSVCVGGYHSGRRGQRWSELQPEEGALISPKAAYQSRKRASGASWCQRSTQNQTVEVVSRRVLVTAVSMPGGVAAVPGSTTAGWGGQLTRSQVAGRMRGLRLLWGQRKHLGPEQGRQDRDEGVAVKRDGCGGWKTVSPLGDSTRYSQEDRGDTLSPERVWLDGELSQSCGHVRLAGYRALWSLFWGEFGATGRV